MDDKRKPTWRRLGIRRGKHEIAYYLDGVKQCTFLATFDGINEFRLTFDYMEPFGKVPKERVIYLADLEKR